MANKDSTNKNSSIKLLIIVLLVVIVCFGGGFYYLTSKNIIKIESSAEENIYVDLGEFTVNLSDDVKNRYAKYRICIGYNKKDSKAKKQLTKESKLPVINDIVLTYIGSKDYEFLNNHDNKETMKEELLNKLNSEVKTFKVTDIRFAEFVLQ